MLSKTNMDAVIWALKNIENHVPGLHPSIVTCKDDGEFKLELMGDMEYVGIWSDEDDKSYTRMEGQFNINLGNNFVHGENA